MQQNNGLHWRPCCLISDNAISMLHSADVVVLDNQRHRIVRAPTLHGQGWNASQEAARGITLHSRMLYSSCCMSEPNMRWQTVPAL